MTSVNKNQTLIQMAVDKVTADADEYGYPTDLNRFHLQLMLDCYVEKGMGPNQIVRDMQAGNDTNRAFWMVINR